MPKPVTSLPDLVKLFWQWWTATNPSWRTLDKNVLVYGRQLGYWGGHIYCGSRGILLALVALRWWWDLAETENDFGTWRAAVSNVHWVLTHIEHHIEYIVYIFIQYWSLNIKYQALSR